MEGPQQRMEANKDYECSIFAALLHGTSPLRMTDLNSGSCSERNWMLKDSIIYFSKYIISEELECIYSALMIATR